MPCQEKHPQMSQGDSLSAMSIQFSSFGYLQAVFHQDSSFTFFRNRLARFTPHTMMHVYNQFDTNTKFGGVGTVKFGRFGQLIGAAYLVATLPSLIAKRPVQGQECADRIEFATPDHQVGYRKIRHEDEYFIQKGLDRDGLDEDCIQTPEQLEAVRRRGKELWMRENHQGWYDGDNHTQTRDAHEDQYEEYQDEECSPWAHWIDSVGFAMIKHAQLMCGNYKLGEIFGDYCHIFYTLLGKKTKFLAEMIGKYKHKSDLLLAAKKSQTLHIPLPFHCFTHGPGSYLPHVNIANNQLRLDVHIEKLHRLIQVSEPGLCVYDGETKEIIDKASLELGLEVNYVNLDIEETKKFGDASYDHLITQVTKKSICIKQPKVIIQIPTGIVLKDMFWFARRQDNYNQSRMFDWSGLDKSDPIKYVEFVVNDIIRFGHRDCSFYRKVPIFEKFRGCPDPKRGEFIYATTFSLYPHDSQPSGCYDLTNVKSAHMEFELQDGLEEEYVEICVFLVTYNVLRFYKGYCGTLKPK